MIRLKINKEPYWLELGYGVKVKVKPCTSAVFYEAKAYMNSKLSELAKNYQANKTSGIEDKSLADIENPIKREALADKFLLIGLGIAGILEWNGVMDAEKDEVAPLNDGGGSVGARHAGSPPSQGRAIGHGLSRKIN